MEVLRNTSWWRRCFWAVLLCLCGSQISWARPRLRVRKYKIKVLPKPSFQIPKDDLACFQYVKKKVKRKPLWSRRTPKTVQEAIKWIQAARKKGKLYWKRGAILGRLQQEIDRRRTSRLHLLFGNNHTIVRHYTFFNELLHPGKDGVKLSGLTHLSLEAFVSEPRLKPMSRSWLRILKRAWSSKGRRRGQLLAKPKVRRKMAALVESDQQRLIDLYLRKNASWAYHILEVVSYFLLGNGYKPTLLREILATLRHARKYKVGRKGKLKLLASDMSMRLRAKTRHLACWIYSLREVFGTYTVNRSSRNPKDVIAYMWGAHHIRKDHFPRYIPSSEKVVSIRMKGGGKPDVWDHALKKLHLPMKMFAIETPGARESDILIHFPAKGRWRPGSLRVGVLSLSHLHRDPNGRRRRLLRRRRYYPSYRASVSRSLKRLQFSLLRCRAGARRQRTRQPRSQRQTQGKLKVQVTINVAGRITRITFPQKAQLKGWSRPCILRQLWRLPLPVPPKRRPLEVLFQLSYRK